MQLRDLSELVAGYVLTGQINADSVDPQKILSPYDTVITMLRKGAQHSEVIQDIGISAYQTALTAVEVLDNKIQPYEILEMMKKSAVWYHVGNRLKQTGRAMVDGEIIPYADIQSLLVPLETNEVGFIPMSEVEATENVWVPTYVPSIDTNFGGYVEDGFTIVAAPPGTGKTSLMLTLAAGCAWTGKKFAFFSLEMPKELVKYRLLQIDPRLEKHPDILDNIIINDGLMDYEEVYAMSGVIRQKYPDLHAIGIDYAEMMIPPNEKESAEVGGLIYRNMYRLAKKIKTPVVLLSQLNSGYVSGIPRVNHIRYTRLAEATASSIWLIYNPTQTFIEMGTSPKLPIGNGEAYLIYGKSRFGYPQGGLGAIQTHWGKERGWQLYGDTHWIGL